MRSDNHGVQILAASREDGEGSIPFKGEKMEGGAKK